nr:MAG TPA: Protein of unknown function (DUF2634) [Caudoviricetes sp.]
MADNLLLPKQNNDALIPDTVNYIEPSHTYDVDFRTDSQIRGYADKLRAMEQSIYKIINTERYQYIIYSWNYGIELQDLFGQPIPYVYAELQRRIEEALLNDDRITKVYNFDFSHEGGDVMVEFDVDTIYGTLQKIKKGVKGIV